MSSDPISDIAESLGIPYLYPIQRFVISNTLEGKNQIVILPTAAGKSLCFQVASQKLPGLTIIVVPLLSLLSDQLKKCAQSGLPAGMIKGGQPEAERNKLFREIREGKLRLIFTTPEAIYQPRIKAAFGELEISHFVVDEAHCVWEWGREFRPAYLHIGEVIKAFKAGTVTAFTATAGRQVLGKIREFLFSGLEVNTVIGNPDRPNIKYRVLPVLSKSRALEHIVRASERPVVVFTRSRKGAELSAGTLIRRFTGQEIFFYHAGLFHEERARLESWFQDSETGILTATCAYGMGVDKPNIRTVIHCDLPFSVEAYLQESGRAGRDGKPTRAFLLYSDEDIRYAGRIRDPFERQRYKQMLDFAGGKGCRREALLALLGFNDIYCSGCDVCEGSAVFSPEAKEEIFKFVSNHKRAYTLRELQQILAGRITYDVRRQNLDRIPGFGLLKDWNEEDVAEALSNMIESSILKIQNKGFWKHSVRPAVQEVQ